MFCPKCGTNVDIDSKFCPKCGNVLNIVEHSQVDNDLSSYNIKSFITAIRDKVPILKNKKFLIILSISVIAIIIIMFVALGNSEGASSPEKAVKMYLTALNEKNADALLSITSDDFKAYFDESLNPSIVKFKAAEYLDSYEITYLLDDFEATVTPFETEHKIDYIEYYENKFGYDRDKQISDVADVEFETIRVKNGEAEEFSSEITCIRIKGRWYVADT